jgi:spore maturation protein A
MMLLGILYAMAAGQTSEVSDALLSSAGDAVTLCITMAGILGVWMGLMQIARDAGLIRALTVRIRPVIHFLFPHIPKEHPANEHIAVNCVANLLGLGWAATPAGLKAMEALAQLEEERRQQENEAREQNGKAHPRRKKQRPPARMPGVASNEMCTFLILNISSLQLIPVNVIAYRSQYGSADPAAIVGPGIVATAVSTAAAVVFCKLMDRVTEIRYH